jgi:hypothetical protein
MHSNRLSTPSTRTLIRTELGRPRDTAPEDDASLGRNLQGEIKFIVAAIGACSRVWEVTSEDNQRLPTLPPKPPPSPTSARTMHRSSQPAPSRVAEHPAGRTPMAATNNLLPDRRRSGAPMIKTACPSRFVSATQKAVASAASFPLRAESLRWLHDTRDRLERVDANARP